MKKSLVILAIVAMAGLSQAAAVKWQATGNSEVNGLTAYLVLNDDLPTTITSISDITGKAADSATISKSGRAYLTPEKKLSLDASEHAPGSTVGYSIFVVSGDKYYNIGSATATVYNDLSTPPESANSDGAVANTEIPAIGGTGWMTPGPIPEPTTVALLALGLAAFGLKRKVA